MFLDVSNESFVSPQHESGNHQSNPPSQLPKIWVATPEAREKNCSQYLEIHSQAWTSQQQQQREFLQVWGKFEEFGLHLVLRVCRLLQWPEKLLLSKTRHDAHLEADIFDLPVLQDLIRILLLAVECSSGFSRGKRRYCDWTALKCTLLEMSHFYNVFISDSLCFSPIF